MTEFYGMNESSFINGYIECMLWSSYSEGGEENEIGNLVNYPLADCTMDQVRKDCLSFIRDNKSLLSQVYKNLDGYSSAGHDFWLTRNGHGAGFWDRGYGVIGDALTDRATEYKELSVYVGDDGFIYF